MYDPKATRITQPAKLKPDGVATFSVIYRPDRALADARQLFAAQAIEDTLDPDDAAQGNFARRPRPHFANPRGRTTGRAGRSGGFRPSRSSSLSSASESFPAG